MHRENISVLVESNVRVNEISLLRNADGNDTYSLFVSFRFQTTNHRAMSVLYLLIVCSKNTFEFSRSSVHSFVISTNE